jgi:ADP-heptose:LPS heptosyltransferase
MTERAASLVYHTGALGDYITTLPAFCGWRRAHPRDQIILLGSPALATLAPPGVFDEVWDAGSRLFAHLFSAGDPDAREADRFRRVRSALLFASASSPVERHLAALGVPAIIRQDPFPSDRTHAVDYHLSVIPGPAAGPDERVPRVRIEKGAAPGRARLTVALHGGSGSREKNWPMERFMGIADTLTREGHDVAWIQGPAEHGKPAPAVSEVWRDLSLTALAGALASCRFYVGNDSGVTHLAAASGCPTIALFGPSDHRVWAPRGGMVRMIVSVDGRIEGIAENDVLREVRSLLGG